MIVAFVILSVVFMGHAFYKWFTCSWNFNAILSYVYMYLVMGIVIFFWIGYFMGKIPWR